MKRIETYEDLCWLIDNQVHESIELEFKRELHKEKNKGKNTLRKAVSALANTNGGQLIIGMDEKDDIAFEICGISIPDYRHTLDNWIQLEIYSPIAKYEIDSIINKKNAQEKIYIIRVEKSRRAPHMFNYKYYKRVETESKPMNNQEVREAMFRTGLRDALILEMKDNIKLIDDFSSNIRDIKHVYKEAPTENDHYKDVQAIIFPFKTEAWKAITYSGLLSIVQQYNEQLIELYNSIYQVNHIIDALKLGHRRICTQYSGGGFYILDVIQSIISIEIRDKLKKILKSFIEKNQET
ncbi:MAG: ATP-binding protein [Candidatus Heimdallarchaeota archaeon]|nr:ATP-binding protein [Candidatus Heimdallarchaeota archaeon]